MTVGCKISASDRSLIGELFLEECVRVSGQTAAENDDDVVARFHVVGPITKIDELPGNVSCQSVATHTERAHGGTDFILLVNDDRGG